jgi:hypothetical protein
MTSAVYANNNFWPASKNCLRPFFDSKKQDNFGRSKTMEVHRFGTIKDATFFENDLLFL